MNEEQWAFICARVSAVEELALALARASPQFDQIRARLIDETDMRRAALQITPMPDAQIEAAMEPFQRLIALLVSSNP